MLRRGTLVAAAAIAGAPGVAAAAPGDADPSFTPTAIDLGGSEAVRAVAVLPGDGIAAAIAGDAVADLVAVRLRPGGGLDPGFGAGGVARVDLGAVEAAGAVAAAPGGRVVLAGATAAGDIVVARLTPAGAPDPSFNGTGVRILDLGGLDGARAVAVGPDGRIVVAGTGGPGRDVTVSRLREDGSSDLGFGAGGTVGLDFGGDDAASAVALTRGGRIVVAGRTGSGRAAIARLTARGAPERGFGRRGRASLDPRRAGSVQAIAELRDGGLVLAGAGRGSGAAVSRLTRRGARDRSFGAGRGSVATGAGTAVAATASGKILVAAAGEAVARVQPGGTADMTFGTSGTAPTGVAASALAIDRDGRIVVAGARAGDAAVARLEGDGPGGRPATCAGVAATIVGTAGPDVLRGTPGPDVIAGLGGGDRIVGGPGTDRVCGGEGDDRLAGGAGRDLILGQAGVDELAGPAGAEVLADPATPASAGLSWPAFGPLTSPFGPRWGRVHEGIDIAATSGTPIRAAAPGRVTFAGWNGGYGQIVLLAHGDGLGTAYAHLSSIGVRPGAVIPRGGVVGGMGTTGFSTGVHLHFEVRINGIARDPLPYLPRR